jgi:S-(hydroxymethyl)glutathione dehydrogenase/alcohol dehydrogenase
MRAAVLTQLNAPLQLLDVEPVLPLTVGQVLVKVLVAGICGAQLQEIRGEKGGPLPHLMGHEGFGQVLETGPGVTRVRPGDHVVMHWRPAQGINSDFPRYRSADGSTFTSGLVTTWAERTICSENRLTPVPAGTDPHLATMLGCSLSTALATVETECPRFGESILVIGAGGLGLALLAALGLVTPGRLTCCDVHDTKRRRVEIAGAEFAHGIAAVSGRYDLVLDTAGHPATMETALEHLAPSGRYVMIGQPPPKAPVCIRAARHLFEGEGKTIKATQGGGFRPDEHIPRFLRAADELFCHGLVTHVYPLDEINAALAQISAGEAGRIMIECHPRAQALAAA